MPAPAPGPASPRQVDAVVFDLDGVLRHFDPEAPGRIERAHGLVPGSLLATAEEPEILLAVITGRTTKAEWIAEVGHRLGSPAAAEEWGALAARRDDALVAVVDELRAGGLPVAILTNGTDETPQDLAALDLDRHVDAVINSAEVGHAKPAREVFEAAATVLGLAPARIAFTDDSPYKLSGARELGMHTRTYDGVEPTRRWLVELGALAGPSGEAALRA